MEDNIPSIEEIEQAALNRQFKMMFRNRMNSLGDIKIGRNESCPCGRTRESGKPMKFKACCGKDI